VLAFTCFGEEQHLVVRLDYAEEQYFTINIVVTLNLKKEKEQ
jgi:hypothetical protein